MLAIQGQMHQDWKIDCWEEAYMNTHNGVANCQFGKIELPYIHRVAQVALRAEVASVQVSAGCVGRVELHLCLSSSSGSGDSLQCRYCKEDIRLFGLVKHSQASSYCSLRLSMPGKLHSPHRLFPDFSARHLDQIMCFLSCGMWKSFFGQFGQIQGKAHVRLFQLYPTS